MDKEQFEDFKKYVEYSVLPTLKNLKNKQRNDIRNLLKNCGEDNYERALEQINLNHNLNLNYEELVKNYQKETKITLEEGEVKKILSEAYELLLEIIGKYIDIKEEYKKIMAIWIIGTYFHKQFDSYPYLFINAMKGSGKTRTLKLIASLIPNGKLIVSLNEAVLFRTAKSSSFCIDEFESVASKEKSALRELLNGAYKQGVGVERAHKTKIGKDEDFVIERYEVFTPICMANIWGIEDVLSDRVVSVYLERSTLKYITKISEDMAYNPQILHFKNLVQLVYMFSIKHIYKHWNEYFLSTLTTLTTLTTLPTHTTLTTLNDTNTYISTGTVTTELKNFYDKLIKTSVDGRNFELFMPLYITANLISEDVLDEIIKISEEITMEKRKEDIFTNPDISLYEFVSQKEQSLNFVLLSDLLIEFRDYLHQESQETREWLDSRWMGRALKRLGLVIDKKRVGKGIEVILNTTKAKNKIKYFKEGIKDGN